jgi:hypothetical protein
MRYSAIEHSDSIAIVVLTVYVYAYSHRGIAERELALAERLAEEVSLLIFRDAVYYHKLCYTVKCLCYRFMCSICCRECSSCKFETVIIERKLHQQR